MAARFLDLARGDVRRRSESRLKLKNEWTEWQLTALNLVQPPDLLRNQSRLALLAVSTATRRVVECSAG